MLLLIHVILDPFILAGLEGSSLIDSDVELPVSYDNDNSYRYSAR